MARAIDISDLVARAQQGQPAAVARLISLVEDDSPALPELSAALAPHTGHAHVVGLTGSPGVGKSTSTSALVAGLRKRGKRVAVLAIDPSSPFSGGALLGDRVRMSEHDTDPEVFIRSMASRGHLGGLAGAAPQALRVLDAAGCDVILVETVGVGQSEVEIAGIADTTLVLLAPGMGDGIQAAKAGILEIGDIFVINKADRDGANTTRRELRTMIGMRADNRAGGDEAGWTPPIVLTVATKGEGSAEVVDEIESHFMHLTESGELTKRRVDRARREIEALALATVQRRLGSYAAGAAELAAEVEAGTLDPFAAASRLLDQS
jgi:LAO/AO transport system kinase